MDTSTNRDISIRRIDAMQTAIELGVDDADFRFESLAERELWVDLTIAYESRIDKDDSAWIAA